MKRRGIAPVLTLLALAALGLGACGRSDGPVPTGNLRLNGKNVKTDWVMRVNGEDVSADEYRYFFMNAAYEYSGGDSGYVWSDEESASVKYSAQEYINLHRALFELAESFGLGTDDADRAEVETRIAETKADFADEASFREALASNYITEEFYPTLVLSGIVQEKLSAFLTGEGGLYAVTPEQMLDKIRTEYVCVRYLMLNADEEGSTANRDRMAEYASYITDGKTLVTYINLYSDDPAMKNDRTGAYLTDGMGRDALVSAARALEIGGISPVVEDENGFYLLMRQPVDEAYAAANVEAFIQDRQSRQVQKILNEAAADNEIVVNDGIYGRISAGSMS